MYFLVIRLLTSLHLQLNSSSCNSSCRFLTHIRNFSSVLHGDGSTPPTPGIPTVTNKTFTSVSLKWDPVQNTTGTAVYLMAISTTGDRDLTYYFSQVRSNVPLAKKCECFIVICHNSYGPQLLPLANI